VAAVDLRGGAGRLWRDPRSLLLGWASIGTGTGIYVLSHALFVPAAALMLAGFALSRIWQWQAENADEAWNRPDEQRARPASGWREIVAALLFVGTAGAGGAGADAIAVVLGVAFAAWLLFAAMVVPRAD
jgi:hypothetical protein